MRKENAGKGPEVAGYFSVSWHAAARISMALYLIVLLVIPSYRSTFERIGIYISALVE